MIYSQFGEIKESLFRPRSNYRWCAYSQYSYYYASETWTIKNKDERKILAFEMRCYRRILLVRWQDHRTNIDINVRKL